MVWRTSLGTTESEYEVAPSSDDDTVTSVRESVLRGRLAIRERVQARVDVVMNLLKRRWIGHRLDM